MTALRAWLTPTRTLLLLLFLLTLASLSTLALFGWRLLEQQRMVEAQRSEEHLEHVADRVAATVRGSLAESSDRVGASLISPGDLLFKLSATSLDAAPPGQLLYYPVSSPDPEPNAAIFAEAELFEFPESQPQEALRAYENYSASADPSLRAQALLRVARVLRKQGRREESAAAYRKLAGIDATVAGVPAGLVATHALCELSHSQGKALELKSGLSSCRWRLTRGQFDFYWSEATRLSGNTDPPPEEKRRLTEIAEYVWDNRANHTDAAPDAARGSETRWIAGVPLFLIWRDTLDQRQVLVTRPESFLKSEAGVRFAFVDAEGRTLAGSKDGSRRAVVRTAAESGLPWTLYVSETKPMVEIGFIAQRRFLLLGLSVMMLFLILGTYFIARTIRREAEVQRMQSHFVSSVSHEFRSPLTSMRQLSEMLALGRVSSDERRQLYYETLVSETSRLQRLIDGLLNFGRMEAGARQYQFQELDAAQIVESVVCDFESQIAHTGKRIMIEKSDAPCCIEADVEALSIAIRNLLDNAVKYSPDQPTVWVSCEVQPEKIAIRIRDQGLGVTASERRTIFRRFMRGSAAAAANIKGSGIGLAMVSHIVEAHGGQVLVSSESGRGSTFTMLFPRIAERNSRTAANALVGEGRSNTWQKS
jgi:signal transduction histidine kinase